MWRLWDPLSAFPGEVWIHEQIPLIQLRCHPIHGPQLPHHEEVQLYICNWPLCLPQPPVSVRTEISYEYKFTQLMDLFQSLLCVWREVSDLCVQNLVDFIYSEITPPTHTHNEPIIPHHSILCTFLRYVQVKTHKMWRYSLHLMGLQDYMGRGPLVLCNESPASVLQPGIKHPVGVTGDSDSLYYQLLRLFLKFILILVYICPSCKIIGFILTFSYCSDLNENVPHRIRYWNICH